MPRWSIIGLLILGLTACQNALPPLKGHVIDDGSVLSAQQEAELEQRLSQHEQDSQQQVVVVTLYSLEGEKIETIANRLSEGWAIGKMAGYRGVLLLVAPREQQLYIHVGVGLRHILGSQEVQQVINEAILPAFNQGQLDQGIAQGVDAILLRLTTGVDK